MSVAEEQEKGPRMNMKKPLAVDHTELAMDPWCTRRCFFLDNDKNWGQSTHKLTNRDSTAIQFGQGHALCFISMEGHKLDLDFKPVVSKKEMESFCQAHRSTKVGIESL
ncbi:hypothetical protein OsI_26390 [Oryza sativa Indica Group]|uniref:Uncharacterized protein n=1 Tax=Oryza sativa subsp. indica TaxID=39946 RepID=B8B771_ORYSI|nr:hypothetical protein OsI_26390 [Oryza sativa Indica Group]